MRSPEDVRQALVRQWVESARDDLAWAEMGASVAELRGVAQIGFHAQQAIEKLLKALLTAYGIEPEDQHSLGRLIDQIRKLDRLTADKVAEVSSLTKTESGKILRREAVFDLSQYVGVGPESFQGPAAQIADAISSIRPLARDSGESKNFVRLFKKNCPACSSSISSSAKRCPECRVWINTPEPKK